MNGVIVHYKPEKRLHHGMWPEISTISRSQASAVAFKMVLEICVLA